MKAPINSNKHYVQQSLATVLGGAASAILIAQAVNAPTSATQVREGAVIKAVFVEMWVRSSELSPGTALLSIVKTVDLQTPTFTDVTNLDAYTNKKNVLYHTQGLTNENSADAIPFVRMWQKVPKGKQRMGLGDSLFLVVASQAAIDNVICGFFVYKEYF